MDFPTPDAASGLYAAVVAGAFGLLTVWLKRRERRDEPEARKTAWQRQAETLRNELKRLYEGQITDLKQQRADDAKLHADQTAEIRRLNRLLNDRRRDEGDDRPRPR